MFSVYWWSRKSRSNSNGYAGKIQELEAALKAAVEKCSAERQGRIRAQRVLLLFFPPFFGGDFSGVQLELLGGAEATKKTCCIEIE